MRDLYLDVIRFQPPPHNTHTGFDCELLKGGTPIERASHAPRPAELLFRFFRHLRQPWRFPLVLKRDHSRGNARRVGNKCLDRGWHSRRARVQRFSPQLAHRRAAWLRGGLRPGVHLWQRRDGSCQAGGEGAWAAARDHR